MADVIYCPVYSYVYVICINLYSSLVNIYSREGRGGLKRGVQGIQESNVTDRIFRAISLECLLFKELLESRLIRRRIWIFPFTWFVVTWRVMFTCRSRALAQAEGVIHHVEDVSLLQDSTHQVCPRTSRVYTFKWNAQKVTGWRAENITVQRKGACPSTESHGMKG